MRHRVLGLLVAALAATPALAAGEGDYGFFSLRNTDFIVLIAFVLFAAILVYFRVPDMLTRMLDDRAAQIRSDIDEARALREEAQTLLASYERKAREAKEESEKIVARAREEATTAARQAREDLERSVERRLVAAEEQIASAEAAALREVRNRAVTVATAAAAEVMAEQMTAQAQNALIDSAIDEVAARLN